MNAYDGNTITKPYTTKAGTSNKEVLTTEINGAFAGGIPNIMDIRPTLFETYTANPNYDVGTATNAYDNAYTWQGQVGATIAGDATNMAAILGVTAKQFLAIGIWAVYVLSILFIFVSKQGQGAETVFVLIISVPVLFIGMNFRIIEIQTVLVATAILVLLFVVKMVFTK
jgi:hypothetical protein